MKALVFLDTHKVGLVDKPIPECGPGDVVVRTTMSSICTSDIHTVSGGIAIPSGRTLGHESVGVVHQVGPDVTGFNEGDRVMVGALTPCGHCDSCQRGHGTQCGGALGGFKWTTQREGNLSEYFLVNDAAYNLTHIPDDVTDEQAVYATDVLSTGIAAAERANIPVGGTVAIIAQGPVGLCATIGARLLGAGYIITTATQDDRKKLSFKFGANEVLNPHTCDVVESVRARVGPEGVDSAIEALGTHETFEQCVRLIKPGGTVVNAGYHGWKSQAPLPIPIVSFGMGMNAKTIRGLLAPGGREHLTRMLRLLENRQPDVDVTQLTTHRFDFTKVEDAFDMMRKKRDHIVKPMISYEGGER
ncbi:threonine dehydrogenase-like Zn-dependent dehydrogenase [Streptomyces sp. V4I8]|uniref:alcohol dehydrogenase catalytic domain-containing protein n=1 Tax=Streptomyces sp. V4I8 TaxID=3156469 RepID=UPI0035147884